MSRNITPSWGQSGTVRMAALTMSPKYCIKTCLWVRGSGSWLGLVRKDELHDEQGGDHQQCHVQLIEATADQLDRNVSDKAQGNAVGDGKRQGHGQGRDQGGGGIGDVIP